jgi:hypothetical protein
MKPLIIIVGVVLLVSLIAMGFMSAATGLNQSQAVRESAQAARIASQGQAEAMRAVIGLVIVVLVLAGLAGFLYFRVVRLQAQIGDLRAQIESGWKGGPYAYWGKTDEAPRLPRSRSITPEALAAAMEIVRQYPQVVQQSQPAPQMLEGSFSSASNFSDF